MATRTSSLHGVEGLGELLHGGGVERVEHLGTRDGEEGDLITLFEMQVFKGVSGRHGVASCYAE
jgi:hypothetical protein